MKSAISLDLSDCFKLASILATILVVSIHYHSKHYIQDIDTLNYLFQEFLTNGVARVAVPYFALSAGFFFFLTYQGLSSYKIGVKKRVNTILVPYLICSVIVFLSQYFYKTVLKGDDYPPDAGRIIQEILLVPVSGQLWFLRDLMVLVLIAPLVHLLATYRAGLGVSLIGLLWLANQQIMPMLAGKRLITIETLFFFCLGAWLVKNVGRLESLLANKKKMHKQGLLAILFLLIVLRVYHEPSYMVGRLAYAHDVISLLLYKVAILLGVFGLLVVSYGCKSQLTGVVSRFTFFVYLYHVLPLSYVVTKLGHFLLPDAYVFYFNFPFATIVSFLIAYYLYKFFPSFYSILAGGRGT